MNQLKVLPFSVQLHSVSDSCLVGRIPAHKLFVEPLIQHAFEIVVFGDIANLVDVVVPPLILKDGLRRMDITQPVLRGYESFWNLRAFQRGAIGVGVKRFSVDWKEIFHWTQFLGVKASFNDLRKTYSIEAIRYLHENAIGDNVYIGFNESSGTRYAAIWATPENTKELMEIAQTFGRQLVNSDRYTNSEKEINYESTEYRAMI